jgi:hypothetical protein
LFKLRLEILIGTIGRTGTRNYHVIVAGTQLRRVERAYGGPKAPANAIAHHGIANFLGNRESNTGSLGIVRALRAGARFNDKRRRGSARATFDAKELGALLEGFESHRARSLPMEGCALRQLRLAGRGAHAGQAESRLRPFARRRAMTRIPPFVIIRLRNP